MQVCGVISLKQYNTISDYNFLIIQNQSMTWFDEHQKGDLLAIMNDDVNQLERFLDKGANDLLQVTTTVIVVGAVFLYLSWEIALFQYFRFPLFSGDPSCTKKTRGSISRCSSNCRTIGYTA